MSLRYDDSQTFGTPFVRTGLQQEVVMRYVILEHTSDTDVHFDLMLEVEGQEELRTIQLAKWPLEPGESCDAKELAPHRRIYLEYEGEISGGRGTVRRVAGGNWSSSTTGVRLGETDFVIRDSTVQRQA